MAELHSEHVDIVIVRETWTSHQEERWVSEVGNLVAVVGHESARKGVGSLLHQSWANQVARFTPISEDLLFGCEDICCQQPFRFCIFSDTSFSDLEVQKVHDAFAEVQDDATKKGYRLVAVGDFSARVKRIEEIATQ